MFEIYKKCQFTGQSESRVTKYGELSEYSFLCLKPFKYRGYQAINVLVTNDKMKKLLDYKVKKLESSKYYTLYFKDYNDNKKLSLQAIYEYDDSSEK